MIINERKNIAEYSIICMFHIHARQCLLRGTLSSACKMGEQAIWAFTMDVCGDDDGKWGQAVGTVCSVYQRQPMGWLSS